MHISFSPFLFCWLETKLVCLYIVSATSNQRTDRTIIIHSQCALGYSNKHMFCATAHTYHLVTYKYRLQLWFDQTTTMSYLVRSLISKLSEDFIILIPSWYTCNKMLRYPFIISAHGFMVKSYSSTFLLLIICFHIDVFVLQKQRKQIEAVIDMSWVSKLISAPHTVNTTIDIVGKPSSERKTL